jgi:hypothetical protein
VVWNHAKMPPNTFLITPDVEKYVKNALKHGFNHY